MPNRNFSQAEIEEQVENWPTLFSLMNVRERDKANIAERISSRAMRRTKARYIRGRLSTEIASSLYMALYEPGTPGGLILELSHRENVGRLSIYDSDSYFDYSACRFTRECRCDAGEMYDDTDECAYCYYGSAFCVEHDTSHV